MARLRRSDPSGPGIVRRRRGRGFSYAGTTGSKVDEPEVLERISTLAIPPAWSDVWICPWANGHIQAIGSDAAGRRQYLYHDDWRKHRDREKFDRMLDFAVALPSLRKSVSADLAVRGLTKRRVLATGVRLLDIGCFRVGGEEYAEEHETFGIATLHVAHVTVRRDEVVFDYPAKGSIDRTTTIRDAEVRRVVASLCRRRQSSDDLLAWSGKQGWIDVQSGDINAYIKEHIGQAFSAKDFRTWSGTVRAAVSLGRIEKQPRSTSARARVAAAVAKDVALYLGNTPKVARSSYIDPRLFDRFAAGETIAATLGADSGDEDVLVHTQRVQRAVFDLLRHTAAAA